MNTSIGDAASVQAVEVALGATDLAAEPLNPADEWRPAAPQGGFDTGRAVRFSVANIGAQAIYALFNQSMPMYLQSYGLPPALIGLLANERSLVGALVQPFVGRLSDRTRTRLGRRRPFFLVGVPLMALSLGLLALHPALWAVLGLLMIGSLFLAIAWDPYMALMADVFPPAQRGRTQAVAGVAQGVGIIIFALLAALLWEKHEGLVFALTSALLVASFAFTFLTVAEPALPGAVAARPRARPHPGRYLRELLQYPDVAKYVLATMFFWMGSGAAVPFITLFGMHALHATESEAFLLPIAGVLTTGVFVLPAGYVADRIGKKAVVIGGLLLYGAGALVGAQSRDFGQAVIALGILGVGNAGTAMLLPLLMDMVPPARTAEFIGLGSSIWSFAAPVGAFLAGWLIDAVAPATGLDDAYRAAFVLAGGLLMLSAVLLCFVQPERARAATRPPTAR